MSTLETRTLDRILRTVQLQQAAQAERDPLLQSTHAGMLRVQMWALRIISEYSDAYERGCRAAVLIALAAGAAWRCL